MPRVRSGQGRVRKPGSRGKLDVTIQFGTSRQGVPHARTLRAWARSAFDDANTTVSDAQMHVVLRIVDRRESRQLNRTWRDKDKPTNVLSFPAGDLMGAAARELGDIAICAPVVAAEARAQLKVPKAHWAHIVVHGILHLLGYDHVREREATVMERSEARILASLNYPDPYHSSH